MSQQQDSDGASLWEGKDCPDCSITNIQPEVGLERLVDLSTISNRNTACLEGRVSQNHRSPGIDRLHEPIEQVFLKFTLR